MKPRPARQILIALLVAFHASVMACGPCLHALPGWGHGPHVRDGRHEGSGKAQLPDDGRSHDCPVCHLLAQGQLPVDPARGTPTVHIGAFIPLDGHQPSPRPARRSSSPRAPPTHRATAA